MAGNELFDGKKFATQFTLEPLSYGAFCGLRSEGQPSDDFAMLYASQECLLWKVKPPCDESIRLEGDKEIGDGGSVYVTIGTATPTGGESYGDGRVLRGMLRWHGERDNADSDDAASYQVALHASPQTYSRLSELAFAGKLPLVRLWAAQPAVVPGWDPDGSDTVWNNKQHPLVEIVWFEFRYELNESEEHHDADQQTRAQHQPVSKADLNKAVEALTSLGQKIHTAVWFVVGAILVVAWASR